MEYNKQQIVNSFEIWKSAINEYKVPLWNELPELELYMDQVVALVNKYTKIFDVMSPDDKTITASMINNYVKLKIIPPPQKKKYSRIHLAYIIIVCILKQTLPMSAIQKFLPVDLTEDEVRVTYDNYIKNQAKAFAYAYQQTEVVATPILTTPDDNKDRVADLVMQVTASANIFKCLSERLIDLSGNKE